MSPPPLHVTKRLLENAIHWFQPEVLRAKLVGPIESQFPNYALPREIDAISRGTDELLKQVNAWPGDSMSVADAAKKLSEIESSLQPLLKQIVLLYRRYRATYTETRTERTFHLEMLDTLEEELKIIDGLVNEEWFQKIEIVRLPRLKDFLPVQYIETAFASQVTSAPRNYDEKFHILQAPSLFLPDLAQFRPKCEDRDTPLAIAFVDIDSFKQFNTKHTETKVDRNLLPRFMQCIEAHVFQHGFAYRQGGDEYLILVPSMSRDLCIAFLDELRKKLACLKYPEIDGSTTVSIGLCIIESECPLTDRELLSRANHAKQFAKENGRNCIATYDGPRMTPDELRIVKP